LKETPVSLCRNNVGMSWGLTSALLCFRDKLLLNRANQQKINSVRDGLLPWGRTSWEEGMGAG